MRLRYTIVFVLLTSIIYGQNSTLYQNVNDRAKELKHNLNTNGDSLILRCERTVYEVVIFNDDFERVIKVRDNDVVISIADIPVGRYIVEALLSDKLIVMTLLRNESFDGFETGPLITDGSNIFGAIATPKQEVMADVESPKTEAQKTQKEIKVAVDTKKTSLPNNETYGEESYTKKIDMAVAGKKATLVKRTSSVTDKENIFDKKQAMASTSSLSQFESKAKASKNPLETTIPDFKIAKSNRIYNSYWVVYKINNRQGSHKMQKMSDREAVDRLIKKNEIDMKTKSGRLNELTVWTVYDPTKFVQHIRMNKDNYMNIVSGSFDIEPYYQKENDAPNL